MTPAFGRGTPAVLFWSTGKDCAHALHVVRVAGEFEVVELLTTVDEVGGKVAVHQVPDALLGAQSRSLGLPLHRVPIPCPCPNPVYERAIRSGLEASIRAGVRHVIFGDLFLEDIRRYREGQMASLGLTCVFPLWGRPTRVLAEEMIASGLTARLSCIDPRRLDRSFAGRTYDRALIDSLPSGVDPCGENGEFHTFATGGPEFSEPIRVRVDSVAERDAFVYAELGLGE